RLMRGHVGLEIEPPLRRCPVPVRAELRDDRLAIVEQAELRRRGDRPGEFQQGMGGITAPSQSAGFADFQLEPFGGGGGREGTRPKEEKAGQAEREKEAGSAATRLRRNHCSPCSFATTRRSQESA